MRILFVAVCVLSPSSLFAQFVTQYTLGIPDVTVEPSSLVDIPVYIEGEHVHVALFACEFDPSELQIIDVEPGPALEAYIAEHGTPPCDVIIFPATINFLVSFGPDATFESAIYGNHLVNLSCSVNASSPATTTIETIAGFSQTITTTVTIAVTEPNVSRGDTNGDGVCDVSDAATLLEHLFVPGNEVECSDAADIDDDGQLVITDVVLLLSALFSGGQMPDETCQPDPTTDSLPACLSSACP